MKKRENVRKQKQISGPDSNIAYNLTILGWDSFRRTSISVCRVWSLLAFLTLFLLITFKAYSLWSSLFRTNLTLNSKIIKISTDLKEWPNYTECSLANISYFFKIILSKSIRKPCSYTFFSSKFCYKNSLRHAFEVGNNAVGW